MDTSCLNDSMSDIVTVREVNGRLINKLKDDISEADTEYYDPNTLITYKSINPDIHHPHHIYRLSSQAFAPGGAAGESPYWGLKWPSQPLDDWRESLKHSKYFTEKLDWLLEIAVRMFDFLPRHLIPRSYLNQFKSPAEAAASLSQSNCRHGEPISIQSVEWHPHTDRLAVVSEHTVGVYHYSLGGRPPQTLKHRLQRDVAAVQWRPYAACDIAVAGSSGLLLWSVDPVSIATRPSPNRATPLQLAGHAPVTSVAWSADGRLVASAALGARSLVVWETDSRTPAHVLSRPWSATVSRLLWSPDGGRLLAATVGRSFSVWTTRRGVPWEREEWLRLPARLHSAVWAPDSRLLLFASVSDSRLYSLPFSHDSGQREALPCYDISPEDYIVSIRWDPSSRSRIAILTPRSLLLLSVRSQPTLQLSAIGIIHTNSPPTCIAFHPNLPHSALLTIGSSCGRVSFFPIQLDHLDTRSLIETPSVAKDTSNSVIAHLYSRTAIDNNCSFLD